MARTVRCRCCRSHTGPRPDGVGWRMARPQRRQYALVCVLGTGAATEVSLGRGSVVKCRQNGQSGRGCFRGTGGRLMWWWVTCTWAPASRSRRPMASAITGALFRTADGTGLEHRKVMGAVRVPSPSPL
uniref:Uncharacterized protein n=1 Tax=Streptomyces sp. HK1 TaxID=405041 RepID=B0LUB2_9ACTN|nr:unknown [Streptomyces sp. HK1]